MNLKLFKTILFVLPITFSLTTLAQVADVKEVNVAMSNGVQRGFQVLIPESNEKDASRAWSSLMKDYDAKTSKVKKTNDYLSDQALIPAISANPIKVYALFQETPEGVYINAFFDLGSGYLNSDMNGDKANAAKILLKSFAKTTAKKAVEEQLKNEEKSLEKLEKEQQGLEKDKADYEKDIEEAKELIAKREKEIEQNIKDQEAKKQEVSIQISVVEKTKEKVLKY
jgi:hypothetical protein